MLITAVASYNKSVEVFYTSKKLTNVAFHIKRASMQDFTVYRAVRAAMTRLTWLT